MNMEWIKVSERLPEAENDMAKVLGFDGVSIILVNYYKYSDEEKGRFRAHCLKCFNEITTITHWMTLPEPPCKN